MNLLNFNELQANQGVPSTGKILIAEPLLNDPNFSRSVVLLCDHNEEGSVGFVINQPTKLSLDDLLPELPACNINVFVGGPVQPDKIHMIHRIPDILGGSLVCDDIFWGGSYDTLKTLLESGASIGDQIRIFIGYSGWTGGQLEHEMKDNTWLVANANAKLLFETDIKNIWLDSINLLGKKFSYLANFPINPQSN